MARRLVRTAPLPPPRWQVELHDRTGKPLGVADAWWPEAGLAWSLGEQQRPLPTTDRARAALAKLGITVLHTRPERLQKEPESVLAELAAAFTYAANNPHR